MTAFDLWNATIDGTNPSFDAASRRELFTWGSNRNFVLGISADGDRPLPERVGLRWRAGSKQSVVAVNVDSIAMAKLHTGIITGEPGGNVRFCGYGSGGRLGQSGRTQFTFEPLTDFPHKVTQLALGYDHTVLLTDSGALYTFGMPYSITHRKALNRW